MNINSNGILNEITGYFQGNTSQSSELEVWMKFFIYLGKYSSQQKNINILLSYIDDVLPTYFITAGVIDERLSYYQNNKEELFTIMKEKILTEEHLIVYTEEGFWREAKVVDVKELEEMPPEFNPYAIVDVISPKQENITQSIPITKWLNKIRLTNRFKATAGTKVLIDDTIPKFLSQYFEKDFLNLLKASSHTLVNIIGFNYRKILINYLEELKFRTKNHHNIKMEEIIIHSDSDYAYINTNIINDLKDIPENDGVNIYIGPVATINSRFSHKKNIFILNRKKNNKEKRDLAIDKFKKNTRTQETMTEDFKKYLEINNITIPKGVECFVTRKH